MAFPTECALLCSMNQCITPWHSDNTMAWLVSMEQAFALAVPLTLNAFPQTFVQQAPFILPVVTQSGLCHLSVQPSRCSPPLSNTLPWFIGFVVKNHYLTLSCLVPCLSVSPARIQSWWEKGPWLLHSSVYLQYIEPCLAHSRCSINATECVNEWTSYVTSELSHVTFSVKSFPITLFKINTSPVLLNHLPMLVFSITLLPSNIFNNLLSFNNYLSPPLD